MSEEWKWNAGFRPLRQLVFLALFWTNLSNNIIVAFYRHLKNSGCSKGTWAHDLCDVSAMIYQLSYEFLSN